MPQSSSQKTPTKPVPGRPSAHRIAVSYIDKTREYYLAQGYGNPYRWARFDDSPFEPLNKPLARSVVTLITTANQPEALGWRPENEKRPRAVHSIDSHHPPTSLFTDDLAWHKQATNTDDLGSYFPIETLRGAQARGRIGRVADRCHGVPTSYSQRATSERDAPEILRRCREDGVDVALLVPL